MKWVRLFATITAYLGFFAVIALISLFFALSDISDCGTALTIECYVAV